MSTMNGTQCNRRSRFSSTMNLTTETNVLGLVIKHQQPGFLIHGKKCLMPVPLCTSDKVLGSATRMSFNVNLMQKQEQQHRHEPDGHMQQHQSQPRKGKGLAKKILASETLEGGSMLPFLAASEAYWKALRNQKDEPHRKGPTVIRERPEGERLPKRKMPSATDLTLMNSGPRDSSISAQPSTHEAASRLSFLGDKRAEGASATDEEDSTLQSDPATTVGSNVNSSTTDYDVVVSGGTLGIFIAATLQQRGHRVCVIDRRVVQGRTQEWNISREELKALMHVGLLSEAELEAAIASEFNPIRVGFKGGPELWVEDCLNLGVSPKKLLESVKNKFLEAGGQLLEGIDFKGAEVYADGVALKLGAAGTLSVSDANRPNAYASMEATTDEDSDNESIRSARQARNMTVQLARAASNGESSSALQQAASALASHHTADSMRDNVRDALTSQGVTTTSTSPSYSAVTQPKPTQVTARLLIDCMGHYSPIVKQIRGRAKPEGMVLVVGSCAAGYPQDINQSADLLYSFTDATDDMQLFWEAFPAEGGAARTTYMFAYSDAHPSRPTMEQLLDTYFELLPEYQGVSVDSLAFKRVLFGAFPCYSTGPLKPSWSRVLQVGDSSAAQSPLSFGGFGSLMRHLPRLTKALDQALREDRLGKEDLSSMHPYQPSLSASWLFQRSMSVAMGQVHRTSASSAIQSACSSSDSTGHNMLMQPTQGHAQPGSSSSSPFLEAETSVPSSGTAETVQSALQMLPAWRQLPASHVNDILAANFSVMGVLGDRVLRPFLQDTIQFAPLGLTMSGMLLRNPVAISRVLLQVGGPTLLAWFKHYMALMVYTLLYVLLSPLVQLLPGHMREAFWVQRFMERLEYGSGLDYVYHSPKKSVQSKDGNTKDLPL
ncbi:hypothetical protein CEUSTIGMA_g12437.t1 [Chlamydomonas eustigma]|uniref:Uncharacterized protein n=1 Tax=Chlamydomonas eustigma TaxID=1157962 RepID=A0A250XPP8_9CHLO|nr:hypothetical protein CEUSTIGMA_g12437.t1 [Chlamydomonas eustigma]|eukprot:GAX85016.1 hypothetical protein CEUSTIGMA_g12437.t1 [Chlamydomonas eustigma]